MELGRLINRGFPEGTVEMREARQRALAHTTFAIIYIKRTDNTLGTTVITYIFPDGQKAEMNWKQIDNYCTNSITRLDVYVLCKLCTVLGCEIQDLLVFPRRGKNRQGVIENICEMVEFIKLAPVVRELEKEWAEWKLQAMSLW